MYNSVDCNALQLISPNLRFRFRRSRRHMPHACCVQARVKPARLQGLINSQIGENAIPFVPRPV